MRRVYVAIELISFPLVSGADEFQCSCVSVIVEISIDSMILHCRLYVTRQATGCCSRTVSITTQPVSIFLKHLLFKCKL